MRGPALDAVASPFQARRRTVGRTRVVLCASGSRRTRGVASLEGHGRTSQPTTATRFQRLPLASSPRRGPDWQEVRRFPSARTGFESRQTLLRPWPDPSPVGVARVASVRPPFQSGVPVRVFLATPRVSLRGIPLKNERPRVAVGLPATACKDRCGGAISSSWLHVSVVGFRDRRTPNRSGPSAVSWPGNSRRKAHSDCRDQ